MADLKDAIEGIKKTIEDAVASGDLIPRADAQAAVALMVEEAARLIISFPGGTVMHSPPQLLTEAHDAVMGLVPASALAELQALRDERDAAVANQFITRVERDGAEDHATETADELRQVRARAEAAEAELVTLRARVERLTGALTIAANRLHRCSVDYDTGTREFIEVGEWADEARAALTEGAAP